MNGIKYYNDKLICWFHLKEKHIRSSLYVRALNILVRFPPTVKNKIL